MNTENKYIARCKKTIFRIIDGQAVILSVTDNLERPERINILNPTGTRIWELLDRRRKLSEIAALLCKEYDIEYKEALREAREFIDQLYQKHLVEVLDS